MKHSTSETDRGGLVDPEAPPSSPLSEAREYQIATPDGSIAPSPALPEARTATDERPPAPLPILAIDGSPPTVADPGETVSCPASAPAPVTGGVRSAAADESGEFLSARVERAVREASSEATKVGLGAAAAALPSPPKKESSTLLGIPGTDRLEPAAQRSRAATPTPPGPPDTLPRFDDNPLIAMFSPRPTRPPRSPALEGFAPLASTTRTLGDNVTLIRPEPVETAPPSDANAARPSLARRPAHRRAAGVFAGALVIVSVGIAWRVMRHPGPPHAEIRTVTLSEAPAAAAPVPETAATGTTLPATALPGTASPAAAPPAAASPAAALPTAALPAAALPETAPGVVLPDDAETSARSAPSIPTGHTQHDLALDERSPVGQAHVASPDGRVEPVAGASDDPTAEPSLGDVELAAPLLDDGQLSTLFALEASSEAYRCPAAEPELTPSDRGSTSAPLSLWRDWRRAQLEGDVDGARRLLCELLARSPGDVSVYTELATLAMRWADWRGAASAAEAGLELSPGDATLSQLLGDASALLGDLERSRRLWTAPASAGKPVSGAQLANQYESRGKAALERGDFAKARTLYRRAVVLSQGALPSSVGLSRALSGLGQARAALGWARRAALAAPGNAKFQMAYGDALYRAGDAAAALRTWREAARSSPSAALRRRLSRGHP